MAYTVFRSDLMSGTDVGADLVSVKYFDGTDPADIENGSVVKLDGLIDGEREIWKGITPSKDTPLEEVVILGAPELHYDERKKNLDEFINKADVATRGYIPRTRNIFSVTKDGLIGKANPDVGDIVELADGTKLNVAAALTSGSTKVGEIIQVEETNRYTYYVVRIGE